MANGMYRGYITVPAEKQIYRAIADDKEPVTKMAHKVSSIRDPDTGEFVGVDSPRGKEILRGLSQVRRD